MNILSIDIGGTAIKAAIVDGNNKMQGFIEIPSNAAMGYDVLMGTLFDAVSRFNNYSAVGISVGGQTNPKTGVMIQATNSFPGFSGTALKEIFEDKFGVPTAVDNDANCVAVAEGMFGAAKHHDDFICLAYGTGIGGAIVIDKKVYYGSSFCAGEFGHMLIHAGGKLCPCGFYGCYEAYASTKALIKSVREALGLQLSGREICSQSLTDPKIKAVLDDWINEVVLGLASLTHIFNPRCIVIGGGIMNNEYVVANVKKLLPAMIMKNFCKVEVIPAMLGNNAGLLGASCNAKKLL